MQGTRVNTGCVYKGCVCVREMCALQCVRVCVCTGTCVCKGVCKAQMCVHEDVCKGYVCVCEHVCARGVFSRGTCACMCARYVCVCVCARHMCVCARDMCVFTGTCACVCARAQVCAQGHVHSGVHACAQLTCCMPGKHTRVCTGVTRVHAAHALTTHTQTWCTRAIGAHALPGKPSLVQGRASRVHTQSVHTQGPCTRTISAHVRSLQHLHTGPAQTRAVVAHAQSVRTCKSTHVCNQCKACTLPPCKQA